MLRRVLVLASVSLCAVVAVALLLRPARAEGPPAAPPAAAVAVERTDLVVTETFDAVLGHGPSRPVAVAREGVVTAVAEEGGRPAAGEQLLAVDVEPIVVLPGELPAYRELDDASSDGADVRQLEQALVDLGHGEGVTVDDSFDAGTAAAVRRWERALGRDDPDGTVELGDVVFLPELPARVDELAVAVGSPVTPGTEAMRVTSTAPQVRLEVSPRRAAAVETGAPVTVTLPGGERTPARVSEVGRVPTTLDQPGAEPGSASDLVVVVTVGLEDPAAAGGVERAPVEVELEVDRERDVLVLPTTALLALAEGGYAVELLDPSAEDGRRLVGVGTGTVSGDRVVVTSGPLREGDEVVVPE